MTTAEHAAQATIAGASALFFAVMGVEPQAVVYALCGCVLGAALAKSVGTGWTGKLYGLATFIAATLICASWATLGAEYWFDASKTARNVIASVLGVGFHPIIDNLIKEVIGPVTQALGDKLRRKIGG